MVKPIAFQEKIAERTALDGWRCVIGFVNASQVSHLALKATPIPASVQPTAVWRIGTGPHRSCTSAASTALMAAMQCPPPDSAWAGSPGYAVHPRDERRAF